MQTTMHAAAARHGRDPLSTALWLAEPECHAEMQADHSRLERKSFHYSPQEQERHWSSIHAARTQGAVALGSKHVTGFIV